MLTWQKLLAFIWLLFLFLSIPAEARTKWRVHKNGFEYSPYDEHEPPPWVNEYDNQHESEVLDVYEEDDASLYGEWPPYEDDPWEESYWSPNDNIEELDEDVTDDGFEGLDEFGRSIEDVVIDMDFEKMDDYNRNVVPNADAVEMNGEAKIPHLSPDDDIEKLDEDVADDGFERLDEFWQSIEELAQFYRNIPNNPDLDTDFEKMDDFNRIVVPNADAVGKNGEAAIEKHDEENSFGTGTTYQISVEDVDSPEVNNDHIAENSEQVHRNDHKSMAVREWSVVNNDQHLQPGNAENDWDFNAENIVAEMQKRFNDALDYVSIIPANLLSNANELFVRIMERFNTLHSFESLPDFLELDIICIFEDLLQTAILMGESVQSKTKESSKSFKEAIANLAPGLNVEDIQAFQNYLDLSHVTIYLNNMRNYGLESTIDLSYSLAGFLKSSYDLAISKLSNVAIHLSFVVNAGFEFLPDVPDMLSQFMKFMLENELVVMLREEIANPFQYFLFEIYNVYMNPILTCFNDMRLYCGSVVSIDLPKVISKYLLKVKKANEKTITISLYLSGKLSHFVQECGNTECLFLTAQNFVQDDMIYYKFAWLILYLVLALFLLYFTYLSNKFTMILCWKCVQLLVKGARHLIKFIVMWSKKQLKGQLKMADTATYCALDEFEVSISQSEYNQLILASENKIQQLRKIMELEKELEDTQGQNMVNFLDMYQKQGEMEALEVANVRQN